MSSVIWGWFRDARVLPGTYVHRRPKLEGESTNQQTMLAPDPKMEPNQQRPSNQPMDRNGAASSRVAAVCIRCMRKQKCMGTSCGSGLIFISSREY